jgi:hypothetical protein
LQYAHTGPYLQEGIWGAEGFRGGAVLSDGGGALSALFSPAGGPELGGNIIFAPLHKKNYTHLLQIQKMTEIPSPIGHGTQLSDAVVRYDSHSCRKPKR